MDGAHLGAVPARSPPRRPDRPHPGAGRDGGPGDHGRLGGVAARSDAVPRSVPGWDLRPVAAPPPIRFRPGGGLGLPVAPDTRRAPRRPGQPRCRAGPASPGLPGHRRRPGWGPYFSELLPAEVPDEPFRSLLASAAATAATELEDFAVFLEGLEKTGRGDWAIGESRYTALLREKELVAVDAGDLHALGQAAYDELPADGRAGGAHRPRCPGVARGARRSGDGLPDVPRGHAVGLRGGLPVGQEFVTDHELVTMPPGERCLVEPSPVFQRPVLAVASYVRPPAFSTSRTGHFFVPYPADGESLGASPSGSPPTATTRYRPWPSTRHTRATIGT